MNGRMVAATGVSWSYDLDCLACGCFADQTAVDC